MKQVYTIIVIIMFSLGLSVFCGKKKLEEQEIVVIDSDTITLKELSDLSADTEVTPARMRQLSLTVALAKGSPPPHDTAAFREAVNDFKDQLSRESGNVWSNDAARKVYCASKMIKEKLEKEKNVQVVKSYIDSIIKKMKVPSDSGSYSIDYDKIFKDSVFNGTEKDFAAILSSLFGIDANLSKGMANFLYSESINTKETGQVNDIVKGLVFDSSLAEKQKACHVEKTLAPTENSALALKFRDQQSIKNTISEHIPNLEILYKKELKLCPDMSGTVYVTFKVNYSGGVIVATIKSSEIKNEKFINPLLDYVKKISFKPIPESVGNMTFDFPFEFKKYE